MNSFSLIAPGHITDMNESEFKETALYYLRKFPNLDRYILINNSDHIPNFVLNDKRFVLINDKSSFSTIPSVGETKLLHNFLQTACDELFIKVHARCPILNLDNFIQSIDFSNLSECYCILRKNLFADLLAKAPSRCYIDTRILVFKGSFGNVLFDWVENRYSQNQSNNMIEHEVFNFICLQEHDKINFLSILPKMVGRSGHGRNYDSWRSKIRQFIIKLLFKIGFS